MEVEVAGKRGAAWKGGVAGLGDLDHRLGVIGDPPAMAAPAQREYADLEGLTGGRRLCSGAPLARVETAQVFTGIIGRLTGCDSIGTLFEPE